MHRDTLDIFIRNERVVAGADRYAPCNPPDEYQVKLETRCRYCNAELREDDSDICSCCQRDIDHYQKKVRRHDRA